MAVEQLSKYWPNLGSSIDAHSSPLGPLSAVLLLWWPGRATSRPRWTREQCSEDLARPRSAGA